MNSDKNAEQKQKDEFFYFDVDNESHQKILNKELEEAKEEPLSPLENVTDIEY